MASSKALGATYGVLYPALREPYKKVFDTIIEGIEQQAGGIIDRYPLQKNVDVSQLSRTIEGRNNRVLIALGLRGLKTIQQLNLGIPVVIGAVLPSALQSAKINSTGISLVPDPELLFRQLKALAPKITTVSVIYNPNTNQSLIDKAKQAARSLGIELDAEPARDLREAALIYKQKLKSIDSRSNAIWLLQDVSTVDSDTILPIILEQAWSKGIIVFSSNLIHAKRGALFAMYPDNLNMGRSLGRLAQQVRRGAPSGGTGIAMLRALKLAVNMRTAKHLGITFSKRYEQSIDLVFPNP